MVKFFVTYCKTDVYEDEIGWVEMNVTVLLPKANYYLERVSNYRPITNGPNEQHQLGVLSRGNI